MVEMWHVWLAMNIRDAALEELRVLAAVDRMYGTRYTVNVTIPYPVPFQVDA